MSAAEVQVLCERASGWLVAIPVHQPDLATGHWHVAFQYRGRKRLLCLHETLLRNPEALATVCSVHIKEAA